VADVAVVETLTLPNWLTDPALRDEAVELYEEALEQPIQKERWKYTRVKRITGLRDCPANRPEISGHEQKGVLVTENPAHLDLASLVSIQRAPEAFAQLCKQPLLHIGVSESLSKPLQLRHQSSSWPIIVDVAPNAHVALTEEYDSDEEQQQTLWLRLGPNSRVTHARNSFGTAAVHWQFVSVQAQAHSCYQLHNHALASPLRRQDTQIQLVGEGAEAELNCAAMVAERLNLDQQITIEHIGVQTSSRQRVHNIVSDRGQSTFNGRIHIHSGGRKSNATLSNRNIGLGTNATINTKPELEIYNDDVSCAHGATIGRLDDNHLFYLCSRGVKPAAARRLLCEGFLNQCVDGPLAESAESALIAPLQEVRMA